MRCHLVEFECRDSATTDARPGEVNRSAESNGNSMLPEPALNFFRNFQELSEELFLFRAIHTLADLAPIRVCDGTHGIAGTHGTQEEIPPNDDFRRTPSYVPCVPCVLLVPSPSRALEASGRTGRPQFDSGQAPIPAIGSIGPPDSTCKIAVASNFRENHHECRCPIPATSNRGVEHERRRRLQPIRLPGRFQP